jgi:hypothetical protein
MRRSGGDRGGPSANGKLPQQLFSPIEVFALTMMDFDTSRKWKRQVRPKLIAVTVNDGALESGVI